MNTCVELEETRNGKKFGDIRIYGHIIMRDFEKHEVSKDDRIYLDSPVNKKRFMRIMKA